MIYMYICMYIEQQGCCNGVVHMSTLTVANTEHRNRNSKNLVSIVYHSCIKRFITTSLPPCNLVTIFSQSCHKVVSYNILTDFSMGTYASFNDSKLAFMLIFYCYMYVRTLKTQY